MLVSMELLVVSDQFVVCGLMFLVYTVFTCNSSLAAHKNQINIYKPQHLCTSYTVVLLHSLPSIHFFCYFYPNQHLMKVALYTGELPPPVFIDRLIHGLAWEGMDLVLWVRFYKGLWGYLTTIPMNEYCFCNYTHCIY